MARDIDNQLIQSTPGKYCVIDITLYIYYGTITHYYKRDNMHTGTRVCAVSRSLSDMWTAAFQKPGPPPGRNPPAPPHPVPSPLRSAPLLLPPLPTPRDPPRTLAFRAFRASHRVASHGHAQEMDDIVRGSCGAACDWQHQRQRGGAANRSRWLRG